MYSIEFIFFFYDSDVMPQGLKGQQRADILKVTEYVFKKAFPQHIAATSMFHLRDDVLH